MKSLALTVILATAALSPLAASAAPAAKAAPAAAAKTAAAAKWTVDKGASSIKFSSSFSGDKFTGTFNSWTADIAFDPKNLAGSKAVVSVDLASASTNDPERDEALPSADWFATAKFPKATFTTTAIKDLGGGKYTAPATLTLRGVTKPATLNFTVVITGNIAKMTGVATVNRNDFGVGQGEFKAADSVPYGVAVNVAVTAKRN